MVCRKIVTVNNARLLHSLAELVKLAGTFSLFPGSFGNSLPVSGGHQHLGKCMLAAGSRALWTPSSCLVLILSGSV